MCHRFPEHRTVLQAPQSGPSDETNCRHQLRYCSLDWRLSLQILQKLRPHFRACMARSTYVLSQDVREQSHEPTLVLGRLLGTSPTLNHHWTADPTGIRPCSHRIAIYTTDIMVMLNENSGNSLLGDSLVSDHCKLQTWYAEARA